MVESRLYQSPLPVVKIALAREKAFAENLLRPLEKIPLYKILVMGYQYFLDQFGLADEIKVKQRRPHLTHLAVFLCNFANRRNYVGARSHDGSRRFPSGDIRLLYLPFLNGAHSLFRSVESYTAVSTVYEYCMDFHPVDIAEFLASCFFLRIFRPAFWAAKTNF